MANIKTSETKIVMRSTINFNELNPKRHEEEAVKVQARNIKKVGILGGIVVNEATSNLLDGHRRLMALDSINKYDGTPETDYEVKVEVCNLDEKTEKEQMTYMAVGNTQADLDLIAKYIGDIDTKDLGLTQAQIKALEQFNLSEEDIFNSQDKGAQAVSKEVEDFFNFLPTATQPMKGSENLAPEEKKALVKAGKEKTREDSAGYDDFGNAMLTLSFDNMENKYAFCEAMGIDPDSKVTKGEELLSRL